MKDIIETVGAKFISGEVSRVNLAIHQFAESLGNAIDAKDHCTCSHSEEVADVVQALGLQMGLGKKRCDLLHIAGHLHDIGKIGIPDCILKKEGDLSDDEYQVIKKHPEMGAQIVAPMTSIAGIDIVVDTILYHHERYDGYGYPHGLKGESIPLEARITAVADTLSAMASTRPYREAISFNKILCEIESCSGSQFDPWVVSEFLKISDRIKKYYEYGLGAPEGFLLSA